MFETLKKSIGETVDKFELAKNVLGFENKSEQPTDKKHEVEDGLAKQEAKSGLAVLGKEVEGATATERLTNKLTQKETLAGIGVAVASLTAASRVEDSKGKETLHNIALGVGALTATNVLADTYLSGSAKTGAKLVGLALTAWFLGSKVWNVGKQLITHPFDSIKNLLTNPTQFLRDANLIAPEDAKKTEAQMKEKNESADKKAAKEGKNASAERSEREKSQRDQLIHKLTFHAEGRSNAEKLEIAKTIVESLSPTTIEMVLTRYNALLLRKKITPKTKLESILETIYDGIKKDEEQAAYDKLGFWQKGVGKATRVVGSIAFTSIPIVGNLYALGSAISGYDMIAGEELSTTGRVIMGVTGCIPFGGVIRGAIRGTVAVGSLALRGATRVAGFAGETAVGLTGRVAENAVPKFATEIGATTGKATSTISETAKNVGTTIKERNKAIRESRMLNPTGDKLIDVKALKNAGKPAVYTYKAAHVARGFTGYEGVNEHLEKCTALNELGYLLGKTDVPPAAANEEMFHQPEALKPAA